MKLDEETGNVTFNKFEMAAIAFAFTGLSAATRGGLVSLNEQVSVFVVEDKMLNVLCTEKYLKHHNAALTTDGPDIEAPAANLFVDGYLL